MARGLEDPDNIEFSLGPRSTNLRTADYGALTRSTEGDIDDPCFDRKQRELARTRDVLTGAAHRPAAAAMAACHDCIGRTTAPCAAARRVVSGRVRLARSDVDRVFGTGAGCRRAGD